MPAPPQENRDTNEEIAVSSGYLLHFSVNGDAQEIFHLLQSRGIRGIPESEVKQKETKEVKIMNRILNRIINNNFKAYSVYGSLPFEKMLE